MKVFVIAVVKINKAVYNWFQKIYYFLFCKVLFCLFSLVENLAKISYKVLNKNTDFKIFLADFICLKCVKITNLNDVFRRFFERISFSMLNFFKITLMLHVRRITELLDYIFFLGFDILNVRNIRQQLMLLRISYLIIFRIEDIFSIDLTHFWNRFIIIKQS
jgi:hypothetical protein